MKKTGLFLGTILVFSFLGALLNMALGIEFPNFGAELAFKVFYMVNGGVLAFVISS